MPTEQRRRLGIYKKNRRLRYPLVLQLRQRLGFHRQRCPTTIRPISHGGLLVPKNVGAHVLGHPGIFADCGNRLAITKSASSLSRISKPSHKLSLEVRRLSHRLTKRKPPNICGVPGSATIDDETPRGRSLPYPTATRRSRTSVSLALPSSAPHGEEIYEEEAGADQSQGGPNPQAIRIAE